MKKSEVEMQLEVHQMKKQAADADRERLTALVAIKDIKEKMQDGFENEGMKDNYVYHQMTNNMKEREGLVKDRTTILPEVTTFPKLEKVQFKLPERPSEVYNIKHPIPRKLKYINEDTGEDITRMNTKLKIFDTDYLNTVNTRRLDDL
jgi:hypothetical protein